MKTIIALMAVALSFTSSYAQADMTALLNTYMKVKDALVRSDSKLAATSSAELLKGIESANAFKQKDALLKSVQKLAKTTDLEQQREAFADVSIVMWEAVKSDGHLHQDIYYQYCPMKKAYWLSEEAAIKNPYYGSKMLTCGNVADKKVH
jgi:phosphorylcholine metabolism protein LicD